MREAGAGESDVWAHEVRACCSALYGHPLARLLLGDFLHPGGRALTCRLLDALGPRADERLLDAAAGRGATALLAAERYGCRVIAVEQSPELAAVAEAGRSRAGPTTRMEVLCADAERLPLAAASIDLVVCECALSTFGRPEAAIAGWLRVLRPGGRLGVTDMTRDGPLPPELDGAVARAACLGGARSHEGYRALLAAGGFEVHQAERHNRELEDLVDSIEQKLRAAEILAGLGRLRLPAGLGERGRAYLRLAREAIAARSLGYSLFIARRPW